MAPLLRPPTRIPASASILRAFQQPLPPSYASFRLSCLKLILVYNPKHDSCKQLENFITNPKFLVTIAKQYPEVEFIVRPRTKSITPFLRGVYSNNRTKMIQVGRLDLMGIREKVKLILDSSGDQLKDYDRATVESQTPSVRGIWSPFHEESA
ncbi:hypothetical protein BT69DRAFT_1329730 [Atractiella rhizophila]|nr:hypothetical protein BT69DRAFT_1329727 [Atractiella rhizophila]KAH8928306.1 hypothetical protein BT69DRAFT_1329730 [Atractiella rhizophila]